LQRDLWAVFDWTRSSHTDGPGRNLRTRLGEVMQRLALSPEEIPMEIRPVHVGQTPGTVGWTDSKIARPSAPEFWGDIFLQLAGAALQNQGG